MDSPARSLALLLVTASVAFAQNNVPVIDTPPGNGAPKAFPVGKALIFPITATDADGDPLTYKVTSDNPKLIVRAKTGNPLMKMSVSYNGGTTGEMQFVLFREWTPITTGFMGGFAQSGFFNNVKFHRVVSGFVIQGGDPNGTGQGGPGMTGGNPATAYKYDNEFNPGLIFSGRGQLAMANSGYASDYSGSNGSQFFVTVGQPRFLDFKHTVFGQMLRGWDVLDAIEDTPVSGSTPLADVTITNATVEANNHDAVLIVSAIGPVPAPGARVKVTVDDGNGGVATKDVIFTTFTVDETNSPPVILDPPHQTVQKETQLNFPLSFFDLEGDYTVLNHGLLGSSSAGALSSQSGISAAILGRDGFAGQVQMGFEIGQFDPAIGQTGAATVQAHATIAIGDRAVRPNPLTLKLAPTVPFSGVVARFKDLDPAAQLTDYQGNVKINWGDGTPIENGVIVRDTATPGLANFAITNNTPNHAYARAGIYTVTVTVLGDKGSLGVIRSTAVVSSQSIVAVGEKVTAKAARIGNRVVATFTDATSPGRPADYLATIDWGDGTWSKGVIARRADASFTVRGTHTYVDSEPFAVCVRIHQNGADPSTDAFAWSLAEVTFKPKQIHMPPFPLAHLVGAWNSGPSKRVTNPIVGSTLNVALLRETLSGAFVVLNSGSKASAPAKVRYWLSRAPVAISSFATGSSTTITTATPHGLVNGEEVLIDGVDGGLFDGTDGGNPAGDAINVSHTVSVTSATQFVIPVSCTNSSVTQAGTVFSRSNPLGGETALKVNALPELAVSAFNAGDGGQGFFTVALPAGNSGAGRYLLAQLVYTDPIVDASKCPKVVISGPIDPAVVAYDVTAPLGGAPTGELLTREDGSAVSFKVLLDTPPVANVVIPVASSVTMEGTVSPATLTFTPANWNVAQTVTVTGVDDGTKDGNKAYTVTLDTPTTSDPNYNGIQKFDINFINLDND